MKKILLACALCLGIGYYAESENPVFPGWYADPEGAVFGDTYWIYPTWSDEYEKQTFIDCFSSKNLTDWTRHHAIIDTAEVKWAEKCMWAPAIVEKDSKYYLFFSANDVHEGEIGGIGVAVADKPEGPFKDLLGKPLINDIVNGAQPIDQFVFHDNGTWYMFYGGWGHCNLVKLNDSFTALLPWEDGSCYREVTPEGYTEGPFMLKRNGKYYFMWSEGGWGGPDYSVAYAISDTPVGPFKRERKILSEDPAVATSAGHHSVIQVPDTDEYYIVYHRRPLGDTGRDHRHTCIDRMTFNDDGTINPVKITFESVGPRPVRPASLAENDTPSDNMR
ncbi:glycoside hydrolase family 43 protein [uncultured Muribaculum sp.]|uniref:glycoside hydrolase family 43 protein n=1 Tax=uncultured Muribaculum sp. TaxID=1918613 RepID=UPI0025D93931|nr:glycoside hydrolase family 43 protein [uncultured Muribaculum sp.]